MQKIAQAPLVRRIRDALVTKSDPKPRPQSSGTGADTIFVKPWPVESADECNFYHTMDIPGYGLVNGQWDLREGIDEYLGGYSFAGKRVLEIGPASGFVTFELERRGATVVSIDVSENRSWDFVPYPDSVLAALVPIRDEAIKRLKKSFWFAHRRYKSRAQVWYGDVYNMPDGIGKFDVAVISSVLLHVSSPLLLMAQCAKRADTLIVADLRYDDLEGKPICRLLPTAENKHADTWWQLSSDFVSQFASVLGYTNVTATRHEQYYVVAGAKWPLFTVIASR